MNRGFPRRMVVLVGAAMIMLVWAASLLYTLGRLHEDALSNGRDRAALHARYFEEHLTQALQIINLTSESLSMARDDARGASRNDALFALVRPSAFMRSISLIDRRGVIEASSNPDNVGAIVSVDEFYPRVGFDAEVLRIGLPWNGRDFETETSGGDAAVTSQPDASGFVPVLLGGDGGSLGTLVALNPDYFINHGFQMLEPEIGNVQWLRYDGGLLMSNRHDVERLQPVFDAVARRVATSESGLIETELSNGERLVSAYRVSQRFPAVVVVNLDRDRILGGWRSENRRFGTILFPLLAALGVVGGVAWRHWRRLAARQAELEEERRKIASVFGASTDGIFVTGVDGRVLSVNPAFEQIFGYRADDVRGKGAGLLLAEPDESGFRQRLATALMQSGRWQGEVSARHESGRLITCYLSVSGVVEPTGALSHYVGVARDISEQKLAAERLNLAASVFSHAQEGIMITSADGELVDVNEAFTRITGYERDEVIGRNPRLLRSGRHRDEFYAAMWSDLKQRGYWSGEIWNRRKSGEIFPQLINISAVADESGEVSHFVAVFSDISDHKEQENRLQRIAHFDALTGLPNRVLLGDRLRRAMAEADRRTNLVAVVFIDLDGFKVVNDLHGHSAGDLLLVSIAERMKEVLREADTISRLGGDEFVAILVDLSAADECIPALERLLEAISRPVQQHGLRLQVTGSLGVSFYPQADDVDADQLLRQADQAMYQSKLAGKNRYHVFDVERDRSIRGRHEGLFEIQRALARGEFELYYQPKVNMRSGEVLGVEALIRWNHPERGLLAPAAFLFMVEGHSLANDVGEWVLRTAAAQLAAWKSRGLRLGISVNIGGDQLQSPEFVPMLQGLLAHHPEIGSGELSLEVLENSALENIEQVSCVMDTCDEMGVSFALDDFGTGYASLTYLRHLPARLLKIDRSFVNGMLTSPDDRSILEGILGLARAFRREVIAEGVETVEHGVLLLKSGCELGQGYAIARPMPAGDIPGWCSSWRPDARWRETGICALVTTRPQP